MVKILGREGEATSTAGKFYVTVVQSVLLVYLERWVVTPFLERALTGFHNRSVQWMLEIGLECQLNKT